MEYAEGIADLVRDWRKRDGKLTNLFLASMAAVATAAIILCLFIFPKDAVFAPGCVCISAIFAAIAFWLRVANKRSRQMRRDIAEKLRDPRFDKETAFQIIVAITKLESRDWLNGVVPIVVREAERLQA